MTGVRTGQSFMKTPKAGGALGAFNTSRPKRSSSIVDLMSARDMLDKMKMVGGRCSNVRKVWADMDGDDEACAWSDGV